MTAINQDFSMYQGDTKNLVVSVTKDDGSELDLTGCTVKWAILKSTTNSEKLVLIETPRIRTDNNTITIPISSTDTLNLLGKYYHECKLIDTQGNASTIFVGYITLNKSNIS